VDVSGDPNKELKLSDLEHEFVIEYFKEMRAEINLRVTTHGNYVVYKIAACGAILSFLFTTDSKDELVAYGVIIVPLIALLWDIMIAKNVRNIHQIARFICSDLESLVPRITLWEEGYGLNSREDRCYGRGDARLLALFTSFTIFCTGLLLYRELGLIPTIGIIVLLVLIFAGTYLFVLECFADSHILKILREVMRNVLEKPWEMMKSQMTNERIRRFQSYVQKIKNDVKAREKDDMESS